MKGRTGMSVFRQSTLVSFILLEAAMPMTAHAQSDDLRAEVEQLKKMVMQQQERITALEAERKHPAEPSASPQPPQPATSGDTQTNSASISPAAQNAGSSDERIRNLERQIKGPGPISFSGDIRFREEPIFGGPGDGSLQRARTRIRARFNVLADLGQQFRAGFTLASGDINDPTSMNQTLTGFYTRKPLGIDRK